MYNVCKYKTAINVHYYLPFLSTVSMSLGMSIIMSVVNSEIKLYIYIYYRRITAVMKVEMDTITVLVITFVYLESIIFISRIAILYNVFSNVMLMMS
jgi:hypothetical protein